MDQPRNARIEAHAAQKRRKAAKEKERLEKTERDKEQMAQLATRRLLNAKVYSSLQWLWFALDRGEGDDAECKRFSRRPEVTAARPEPRGTALDQQREHL